MLSSFVYYKKQYLSHSVFPSGPIFYFSCFPTLMSSLCKETKSIFTGANQQLFIVTETQTCDQEQISFIIKYLRDFTDIMEYF